MQKRSILGCSSPGRTNLAAAARINQHFTPKAEVNSSLVHKTPPTSSDLLPTSSGSSEITVSICVVASVVLISWYLWHFYCFISCFILFVWLSPNTSSSSLAVIVQRLPTHYDKQIFCFSVRFLCCIVPYMPPAHPLRQAFTPASFIHRFKSHTRWTHRLHEGTLPNQKAGFCSALMKTKEQERRKRRDPSPSLPVFPRRGSGGFL